MPAAYAHYVFGQKVLKELPRDLQERIKDYLPLYHIGIHGPDILFYYEPLHSNEISRLGYEMHDAEAEEFFENARRKILAADGEEKMAMEAYIAGFICHFMLDSECHGYVAEKMEESGISHSEIETEFDSMLMRKKGLDPHMRNAAKHVMVNEKCAEIIAPFFGLEPRQILKAVKSMKRCHTLLLAPKKSKRVFLDTVLKVSGNYDSIHGMIVNEEPNPRCVDSNWELFRRLKAAVEPCEDLIEEYLEGCTEIKPLNDRFRRNFE